MRRALLLTMPLAALLVLAAVSASATGAASTMTPTVVPLIAAGSTSFTPGAGGPGGPVVDTTEIDQATNGDTDSGDGEDFGEGVNRTLPGAVTGKGKPVSSSKKAKSNPELGTHFQGLNLFDQRFANGGNQFSVEPPRSGALRRQRLHLRGGQRRRAGLHGVRGAAASGVIDLNTFYGYPPAIVRSGPHAGERGPSITDPVCHLRPGDPAVLRRRPDSRPRGPDGRDERQQPPRHRRQRYVESDWKLDDLLTAGAEQRHAGHA